VTDLVKALGLSWYLGVLIPHGNDCGPSILLIMFFCLGACLSAFQFRLPVMFPIVFAFVENENTDNWYWFLECVKAQVVSTHSDIYFITYNLIY
jgi:hypothetical protein